jgi:organic radical activating enzyme
MIYFRKPHQQYDAWIHWEVTTKCNMRCKYCFFADGDEWIPKDVRYLLRMTARKLRGEQYRDTRTYGEVHSIDIPKLLATLDHEKKIFRISFTGGEPFLVPNMTEVCLAISKKHYLMLNTNLSSLAVVKFAKTIDPDRVLFIVASLHLKELERMKLEQRYIDNYLLLEKKGFVIFARVIAHPTLVSEAQMYRNRYKKFGIDIGYEPFLGTYLGKQYPAAYTTEELSIFHIPKKDLSIHTKWKNKLCIAGMYAAKAETSGNVVRCFEMKAPHGNMYTDLKFLDKPFVCPLVKCGCPFNSYDPYLYQKYLKKI